MKKLLILLTAVIAATSVFSAGCTDKPNSGNAEKPSVTRSVTDENKCPEPPEDGNDCPDGRCKCRTPHPDRDGKFRNPEDRIRRRRRKDDGLNPKPPQIPSPVPDPDNGRGENS